MCQYHLRIKTAILVSLLSCYQLVLLQFLMFMRLDTIDRKEADSSFNGDIYKF